MYLNTFYQFGKLALLNDIFSLVFEPFSRILLYDNRSPYPHLVLHQADYEALNPSAELLLEAHFQSSCLSSVTSGSPEPSVTFLLTALHVLLHVLLIGHNQLSSAFSVITLLQESSLSQKYFLFLISHSEKSLFIK